MNVTVFHKLFLIFNKLSLKKKVILIVLTVIICITTIQIIKNADTRKGYIFENATTAPLTEVVTESGTITPDGIVPLYSPTNGSLTDLYVANNEKVTAGQELFKVVSSATETEKQNAYATYLTAKASLDANTASLYSLQSAMYSAWKTYTDIATNSTYENDDGSPNTSKRMLPEFTTVQDDWFAAEANYKNQQGVIAKDQASVTSAYLQYLATQTTVVKSPINGIVSNLSFSPGSTLTARSAFTPSVKPVLLIKNSDGVEAVISVGQTNIAKVSLGQNAIVKPDAYKDRTYNGTVIRVDDIGENNQGVVTYNVYIAVTSDEYLRPGMTVDVDITTKKIENTLTVPNSAVVLHEGMKTVRILSKNTITYTPVETGVKGETRTQILNGISEGQEIIVALTNEKAQRPSLLGL